MERRDEEMGNKGRERRDWAAKEREMRQRQR
jgi:hypothetical protein